MTTSNTKVLIGRFAQYKIGSLRFFTPLTGVTLDEMAKELGYDLQSRVVLDYENEYAQVMEVATEFKTIGNSTYPLIITKKIFK